MNTANVTTPDEKLSEQQLRRYAWQMYGFLIAAEILNPPDLTDEKQPTEAIDHLNYTVSQIADGLRSIIAGFSL